MEIPDCAKTKKTVLRRHKISRDRFLFCSNMPFWVKKQKYEMILQNDFKQLAVKRFMLIWNQLAYLAKNVKQKSLGSFPKEKNGSGVCT